jgi:uncharacterized membrane protein
MSAASPSLVAAGSNLESGLELRRRMFAGLTGVLVLIALAAAVGIVGALLTGQWPSAPAAWTAWSWLPTLIIVILAVVVAVWVVRMIVTGFGGPTDLPRVERPRRRYRYPIASGRWDSAVVVARERFARGEISEEQLDRILRQLGEGPGPLPPE